MQQLAPARRSGGLPQYGLMSLWDMFEFNAVEWIELVERLNEVAADSRDNAVKVAALTKQDRKDLNASFRRFARLCQDNGLETAKEIAEESSRNVLDGDYPPSQYEEDLRCLRRAVIANMRSIKFMRVSADFVRYLNCRETVIDNYFPDVADDFRNAGNALAFGLATASVFHCMRMMEAGLKLLAAELGIPYAPSWESYLKQMNDRFGEKWKDKAAHWKTNEEFYRQLAGDLQLVKFSWRNPTMHIERHYDQSEAFDIYRAVLGFMKRLAQTPSLSDAASTS